MGWSQPGCLQGRGGILNIFQFEADSCAENDIDTVDPLRTDAGDPNFCAFVNDDVALLWHGELLCGNPARACPGGVGGTDGDQCGYGWY